MTNKILEAYQSVLDNTKGPKDRPRPCTPSSVTPESWLSNTSESGRGSTFGRYADAQSSSTWDTGYRELGELLALEKAASGGKIVTEVPAAATEQINASPSSKTQKVRKTARHPKRPLPSLPSDEATLPEAEHTPTALEELT
ncbi:hypothetical protein RUND412_004071 [Rhizina undulata]